MGRMAAEAGVLDAMLDALCGWERPADSDRVVREALAEALLMLVGARVLAGLRRSCLQSVAVGVYGNVRQCRGTTELSGTPALQLGLDCADKRAAWLLCPPHVDIPLPLAGASQDARAAACARAARPGCACRQAARGPGALRGRAGRG